MHGHRYMCSRISLITRLPPNNLSGGGCRGHVHPALLANGKVPSETRRRASTGIHLSQTMNFTFVAYYTTMVMQQRLGADFISCSYNGYLPTSMAAAHHIMVCPDITLTRLSERRLGILMKVSRYPLNTSLKLMLCPPRALHWLGETWASACTIVCLPS